MSEPLSAQSHMQIFVAINAACLQQEHIFRCSCVKSQAAQARKISGFCFNTICTKTAQSEPYMNIILRYLFWSVQSRRATSTSLLLMSKIQLTIIFINYVKSILYLLCLLHVENKTISKIKHQFLGHLLPTRVSSWWKHLRQMFNSSHKHFLFSFQR